MALGSGFHCQNGQGVVEVILINERGEVVPIIVEEDKTVSLPIFVEVEAMREQGKIQPAQKEMLTSLPIWSPIPQPPPRQTPFGPLLLTPEEQMVLDIIME